MVELVLSGKACCWELACVVAQGIRGLRDKSYLLFLLSFPQKS